MIAQANHVLLLRNCVVRQSFLYRLCLKRFKIKDEAKDSFYESLDWKQLKEWASALYEKRCFCCKSTEDIHLDHIKPISTHPKLALRFDNLQYLCRECNELKSNMGTYRFPRLYCSRLYPGKEALVSMEQKWSCYFPELEPEEKYASIEQLLYLNANSEFCESIPTRRKAEQQIRKIKENIRYGIGKGASAQKNKQSLLINKPFKGKVIVVKKAVT